MKMKIFVASWSTKILIESSFWLGMYLRPQGNIKQKQSTTNFARKEPKNVFSVEITPRLHIRWIFIRHLLASVVKVLFKMHITRFPQIISIFNFSRNSEIMKLIRQNLVSDEDIFFLFLLYISILRKLLHCEFSSHTCEICTKMIFISYFYLFKFQNFFFVR